MLPRVAKWWVVGYLALAIALELLVWRSVENIKINSDDGQYQVFFQSGALGPSIKRYRDILADVTRGRARHLSAAQTAELDSARRATLSRLAALKHSVDAMIDEGANERTPPQRLGPEILEQADRLQSILDVVERAHGVLPRDDLANILDALEDSMAFFGGAMINAMLADLHTQAAQADRFAKIIRVLFSVLLILCMVVTHLLLALRFKNRELSEFATLDPLTGVLNRRSAVERAGGLVSLAEQRSAPISFAVVDLDHFKVVNDTYGHPAGDAILRAVAATINMYSRPHDIVARLGGEEFILVMPDVEAPHALQVCERIRCELEKAAPVVDGMAIRVTASIGLATRYGPGLRFETLYRLADHALYQAKRAGRNRTVTAQHA